MIDSVSHSPTLVADDAFTARDAAALRTVRFVAPLDLAWQCCVFELVALFAEPRARCGAAAFFALPFVGTRS